MAVAVEIHLPIKLAKMYETKNIGRLCWFFRKPHPSIRERKDCIADPFRKQVKAKGAERRKARKVVCPESGKRRMRTGTGRFPVQVVQVLKKKFPFVGALLYIPRDRAVLKPGKEILHPLTADRYGNY
jgi:hypothetical protein